jgi:hypothetical protein
MTILRLGTNNTIRADTINLGSTRSEGTMNFDSGSATPTVTIEAQNAAQLPAAGICPDRQESKASSNPSREWIIERIGLV